MLICDFDSVWNDDIGNFTNIIYYGCTEGGNNLSSISSSCVRSKIEQYCFVHFSSSGGSSACSGEFDWNGVSVGFVDAFPVFALIFGIWCIIKLLRMVW